MTEIKAPYNVFFGEDGYPLEGGFIFIGLDGLNPLSNPQQAYWDPALTIPAANVRTSGGRPSNNGVVGRLYVPGDYSILVQDKNGRTVYSQLSVTFEYSDLLVTESRGTLTRSARSPLSFSMNTILETGFYAWANGATTNYPVACAAGDLFELQVVSAPDGAGVVVQTLVDATIYRRFARLSLDAGTTWSTWKEDDGLLHVEELTGDEVYTAAELDRDRMILLGAGCSTVDVTAGASKDGVRLTFVQVDATPAVVTFGTSRAFSIAANTVQELVWDDTNSDWRAPVESHGHKTFGPGALAATVWKVPPGIRKIWVTGVGQGGSAGAASTNVRGGGGGGSGAWCDDLELSVVDGEDITVTLSASAASTLVSALSGVSLSFGKGGNGSDATAGSAGVGAGGVSNGYAGGAGSAVTLYGGGGGGGIGGVGAAANTTRGGAGGGSGGAGTVIAGGPAKGSRWLNGVGGTPSGAPLSYAHTSAGPGGGGYGGGNGGGTVSNAGGAAGVGGGAGGGCGKDAAGTAGVAGDPFIVIEW